MLTIGCTAAGTTDSEAPDVGATPRPDAGHDASRDATWPATQDAATLDRAETALEDAATPDRHVKDSKAPDDAPFHDGGVDCTGEAGEAGDAGGAPSQLACTGLYSDWASGTIAPSARAYTPGLVLWSDGAEKVRYISLPPGTRIDTTDMDQWTFPVGTKLWKQFSLDGRLVETRFLWKRGDGDWVRTTYAWSLDGSTATELTSGQRNWNGTSYEIPPQKSCQDCHAGRLDKVLGFEAVALSAAGATGVTLDDLVREGLLTQPPAAPIVVPGNPTESAALGWLHANCGISCHNSTSFACGSTLLMRLGVAQLGTVQATDTWNTAVGKPLALLDDAFVPPRPMLRITPGDPSRSAVSYRASVRDSDPAQPNQMPPLDTHVVPDAGVALLNAWIQSMPPAL